MLVIGNYLSLCRDIILLTFATRMVHKYCVSAIISINLSSFIIVKIVVLIELTGISNYLIEILIIEVDYCKFVMLDLLIRKGNVHSISDKINLQECMDIYKYLDYITNKINC